MEVQEKAAGLAIPPHSIWRQQRPWRSLGRPILTNAGSERIQVEIIGLEANRSQVIEQVTISANQSVELARALHNLLFLFAENFPGKPLRVESPIRNTSWQITPATWSNLWFYQPNLLLAGWLTAGDADQVFHVTSRHAIHRKASYEANGSSGLCIRNLRPIGELILRSHHI